MSLTLAWSDVVGIAPELATLDVAQQTAIVADVKAFVVNVAALGGDARATATAKYLAAHLGSLTKGDGAGASAPLQSVSIGGVSKSFAVSVAEGVSVLESTRYGREYQRRVRSSVLARMPVIGC